jgi:hypothetical protein
MASRLAVFFVRAFNSLKYRINVLLARFTRALFVIEMKWGEGQLFIEELRQISKPKNTNPNGAEYFSDCNLPFVSDPELGVWNRPTHHFIKKTVLNPDEELVTHIWFDSNGIRVQGENQNIADQVDILVVGESNTWGQGVSYHNTYAALLGEKLGMSVANLGLIGSNGVQGLLLVRRYLPCKPKLIVYGFWEEHFASNIRRCPNIDSPVCLGRPVIKGFAIKRLRVSLPWRVNTALKQYRKWYQESALGPHMPLMRRWYWTTRILARVLSERYIESLRRGFGDLSTISETPAWNDSLNAALYVISEMKALADSVGAKLVIAYMPIFFSEKMHSPPSELRQHTENLGVIFVDMEPIWRERKCKGEKFYFAHDMHLDSIGHADVSDAIAHALKNEMT